MKISIFIGLFTTVLYLLFVYFVTIPYGAIFKIKELSSSFIIFCVLGGIVQGFMHYKMSKIKYVKKG
jgi:ABC-type antimicrobial peptide transport system permease subunit